MQLPFAFPFLGDLVNALAVVAGSLLGVVLGRFVTGRMQQTMMQATGLGCAFIGLAGALAQMLAGTVNASGEGGGSGGVTLAAQNSVLLVVSLILGSLVGQALDIEGKMGLLGDWLRRRVTAARAGGEERAGSEERAGGEGRTGGTAPSAGSTAPSLGSPAPSRESVPTSTAPSRFNEAFISGALIVCPGAMAVLGGLEDGMAMPQTLFVKATLDFVITFILASSLGVGTAFAALPLFVYQAVFVLIGLTLGNVMTDAMTSGLSMVGNAIIFAVGINLLLRDALGPHKISAGNMVPAMLVPVLWALVTGA